MRHTVHTALALSHLRRPLGALFVLTPLLGLAGATHPANYVFTCVLLWVLGLFTTVALTPLVWWRHRPRAPRTGGGAPVGFFPGEAELFRPWFGRAHERGHGLYAAGSFLAVGLGAVLCGAALDASHLIEPARDVMKSAAAPVIALLPAVLVGAAALYRAAGPLCRGTFREQLGPTPLHLWCRASVPPETARRTRLWPAAAVVGGLSLGGAVLGGTHPVVAAALTALFAACWLRLAKVARADRAAWQAA